MCDVWKKPPVDELKPCDFAKLPKSLKYINISGGEPFLRDDLPEVIYVINNILNKPEIDISTNGFLSDRIVKHMEEIMKLKAKVGIRISIDGIGKRHDEMRGVTGAFDKAMASLEKLKILGLKDIGLAYTATDSNLDQLMEVMALSKKLKVQFTANGVAHTSELTFKQSNPLISDLDLLNRQFTQLDRELLKSMSIRKWARAFINSGTPYYAATGKRKLPCFAGTDFFFMTPNGDIHPCMVIDFKFGNIKEQTFDDIWAQPKADKFRNLISDVTKCNNQCWMICTVFPWMRKHKLNCAMWLVMNKIRVYMGLPIKPVQ
jgi:radical SAM protein with 4Fe4S-binding SPASM domain